MERMGATAENGAEEAAREANHGDLTSLHSLHGIFNLEDVSIRTGRGLENKLWS